MWSDVKKQIFDNIMNELKTMDWTSLQEHFDLEEYVTKPILNKVSDHFKHYFLILTIVFIMLIMLMFLNTYLIFSCLQSLK